MDLDIIADRTDGYSGKVPGVKIAMHVFISGYIHATYDNNDKTYLFVVNSHTHRDCAGSDIAVIVADALFEPVRELQSAKFFKKKVGISKE